MRSWPKLAMNDGCRSGTAPSVSAMRGDRNREPGRLFIAAFVIVLLANVVAAVWGLVRAIWH